MKKKDKSKEAIKAKGSGLEQAIARMDAPTVIALANAKGKDGMLHALRTIWASDSLIEKRPSTKKATRRSQFLTEIAAGFSSLPEVATKIVELIDVVDLIEKGYVAILSQGKSYPGAALSGMTQVSTALHVAGEMQKTFDAMVLEQMPAGPAIHLKNNLSVNGRVVNPDTEMFGVLKAARSTIMMMAWEHDWFNYAEQVELPSDLSQPSVEEVGAINKVLEYANIWHAWERAQLRLRLGLRSIEYLPAPFPDKIPITVETVLNVMPDDDCELADFIAGNRLLSRTNQQYAELFRGEFQLPNYPDKNDQTKLPPFAYISFDEKLGIGTINQCVSYDVTTDSKSYAGLRIVEWLRGYSVLKRIADDEISEASIQHVLPHFSERELLQLLTRAGLPVDRAHHFIEHVCLTKSRNDPYDRPLIRIADNRYALVWPALKPALLGPIVLSAIADAGAQIEIKGTEFEKTIRKVVSGPGREVSAFKTKRGKEEYDYDALLVWGDFCFLFECKNRSLSGGILQYVYRSNDEYLGHAKQVRRLVDGLMKHPDMLSENFPAARGKLLVPCVISALPYSVPGGVEGVLFADYSMLKRFFISPVIGEVCARPGEKPQRQAEGEIFRLWVADEPTPFDLIRQLTYPFQFMLTKDHTRLSPTITAVFTERDALLHGEYSSVDLTVESGRATAQVYNAEVPLRSQQEWESILNRIP